MRARVGQQFELLEPHSVVIALAFSLFGGDFREAALLNIKLGDVMLRLDVADTRKLVAFLEEKLLSLLFVHWLKDSCE
jgi:hypothetical protein